MISDHLRRHCLGAEVQKQSYLATAQPAKAHSLLAASVTYWVFQGLFGSAGWQGIDSNVLRYDAAISLETYAASGTQ